MKSERAFVWIVTCVVAFLLLFSLPVWGGIFNEEPPVPPFGFSTDGNAKGAKLSGVIAVKITHFQDSTTNVDSMLVIVRLTREGGNVPPQFANTEAIALTISNNNGTGGLASDLQSGIQEAIIEAIAPWIGATFFGVQVAPEDILVKKVEDVAFDKSQEIEGAVCDPDQVPPPGDDCPSDPATFSSPVFADNVWETVQVQDVVLAVCIGCN